MRPLRLELQAFGPYPHRQVIDFAELGAHSVFLIHGPTGAGKTTILDAMCFALFGDTSSGTEREARTMRSHHAKPGDVTEVRLDFELHGARYRVERAPEQEKWSEKGTKRLVKSAPRATLWKVGPAESAAASSAAASSGVSPGGAQEDSPRRKPWESHSASSQSPVGAKEPSLTDTSSSTESAASSPAAATQSSVGDHILASKYTDVTAEVERLLGFTSDQFRQVILIPQGKFRDMLCAKESDREEVLRYLFQTMRYDRLEQFLKDREKLLRQQYESTLERRAGILSHVPNAQTIDDIQNLIASLKTRQQTITADLQSAITIKSAADAALQKAREQNRLLQERNSAAQAWQAIQQQLPAIESRRGQLQRASGAKSLDSPYALLSSRRKDLTLAQHDQSTADAAAQKAQSDAQGAVQALKKHEQSKPRIEQLGREIASLEDSRKIVEELDIVTRELDKTQTTLRSAKSAADKAQSDLSAAEAAHQKMQQQLEKSRNLAAQLDSRKQLLDLANRRLKDANTLRKLEPELLAGREYLIAEETKLDQKRQQYARTKRELEQQEQAWRESAAARLAQQLADGKPCPVCGSTHHPQPQAATAAAITDDQLNQLRQDHEAIRTAGEKLKEQVVTLKSKIGQQTVQLDQLRQNLGDAATATLDHFESAQAAADRALRESQAAADSLPRLQNQLAQSESSLQASQTHLKQSQETLASLQTGVATLTGQHHALHQRLPESLQYPAELDKQAPTGRHPSAQSAAPGTQTSLFKSPERATQSPIQKLEAAIKQLTSTKANLLTSLEFAENARNQADQKLAAALEAARNAATAVEQRKGSLTEAQTQFQSQLRELSFASEQEYLAARLTDSQVDALQNQINDFIKRESATRARLDKAEHDAANLTTPALLDLPALEQSSNEATARVNSLNQQLGELRNQVTQLAATSDQLARLAFDIADIERRHGVIATLSSIASGKNNLGVPLERFVLGFMLDDVTVAASLRLKHMSRGRYLLQRQRNPETRQPVGLGLEVFDSYTGMNRDVSTLSGGESFLASLSFALGLADIVQARAGGVAMETIFIDEGFGALDSETLEEAINAITHVTETGRLVGIISHVPELRDRIPAQLQVTPTRTGSQAKFVIR